MHVSVCQDNCVTKSPLQLCLPIRGKDIKAKKTVCVCFVFFFSVRIKDF